MALTDLNCRSAKPKSTPFKLSDETGLFLLVQTSGARYWRFAYRFGGKQKTLALGVYPEVSLAEAREKRDESRKLLRSGVDPSEAKQAQKQSERAKSENAFASITREWLQTKTDRWTDDHAKRVLRSLEADAFPDLGSFPINEITAPQVLTMIRKIEARSALETAARILQRVSAVFRYGIITGRCERNPALDLKGAIRTRKVTHRAALEDHELPEFLRKLQCYEGHMQTRLGLRFLILTAVRTAELRGARWEEIDFDRAEWRIPAERMKMKSPHLVPLSRQALAVLRQLQPISGAYELVFPSLKNPSKPISENTLLYALYRMGYHSRATGHGFRATFSTILNEQGFRPDVIERQLAHVEANKVRAAYHRSEYLADRKDMMQSWADYLDRLSEHGNVVPFRKSSSPAG